jgi:hypothetical protein
LRNSRLDPCHGLAYSPASSAPTRFVLRLTDNSPSGQSVVPAPGDRPPAALSAGRRTLLSARMLASRTVNVDRPPTGNGAQGRAAADCPIAPGTCGFLRPPRSRCFRGLFLRAVRHFGRSGRNRAPSSRPLARLTSRSGL